MTKVRQAVKRDATGLARNWTTLSPSLILASYDGMLVAAIPEARSCGEDDLAQVFTEKTVRRFGVPAGRKTPLPIDFILEVVDEGEPDGVWPFRELVGTLMYLLLTRRNPTSRAVAKFAHVPKQKHWKAGRGILE